MFLGPGRPESCFVAARELLSCSFNICQSRSLPSSVRSRDIFRVGVERSDQSRVRSPLRHNNLSASLSSPVLVIAISFIYNPVLKYFSVLDHQQNFTPELERVFIWLITRYERHSLRNDSEFDAKRSMIMIAITSLHIFLFFYSLWPHKKISVNC